MIAFQGIVDEKTLGEDAFTIIPKPTDVYSYFNQYENRWQISWPRQPQTDYTLTLAGDISDIFGNELGEQTVRFQTGDRKPFAHLNVPNDIGTYDAYAPSEIAASYRNVSSLDFKLYEVNETQTERLLGPNRYDALNNFNPAADALVREWSVPVTPEANTNNLLKVPLAEDEGALAPGVYWLEMRAPEVKYGDGSPDGGQQPARHLLIVSPLNLIAKRTATEVLVWATDLQSGQPVADLPVRANGDVDAAGVTDADGIVRLAATNTGAVAAADGLCGQCERKRHGRCTVSVRCDEHRMADRPGPVGLQPAGRVPAAAPHRATSTPTGRSTGPARPSTGRRSCARRRRDLHCRRRLVRSTPLLSETSRAKRSTRRSTRPTPSAPSTARCRWTKRPAWASTTWRSCPPMQPRMPTTSRPTASTSRWPSTASRSSRQR